VEPRRRLGPIPRRERETGALPPAKAGEHALSLVPDVFLLLRLAFLESISRTELLEHSGLRRVLVFRKRLPRMHRSGWDGPKSSSSMAFAWYAWKRNFAGPTTITRI